MGGRVDAFARRERAARALCRLDVHPENTMFEGKPMWQSYLDQVDAVLEAALGPEEWARVKAEGPTVAAQAAASIGVVRRHK